MGRDGLLGVLICHSLGGKLGEGMVRNELRLRVGDWDLEELISLGTRMVAWIYFLIIIRCLRSNPMLWR